MNHTARVYVRWLKDRRVSTIWWTVGITLVSVVTSAFYSSLGKASDPFTSSGSSAMSSMLGLGDGIDPSSPVGFLWSFNYSNQLPWLTIALGIALGTAAIAGDESEGTLEYLLAKPISRTEVALARFAGMVSILFIASVVNLIAVWATLPLFGLNDSTKVTGLDGKTSTVAGAGFGDLLVGGLAVFAVALGAASIAFLVGAATGRRAVALGVGSGIAVAGYVLYTLANITGKLDWLTWFSPWRWFMADAMMVKGLSPDILLPFGLAVVCLALGWLLFVRRDLHS